MAKKDPLKTYRGKRDFSRTPEPGSSPRQAGAKHSAARKPRRASKAARQPSEALRRRVFVVQLHDARRLHYDFRLEVEGTLKSWAVPKGPSMNPRNKHLAVMVEDHPLEYAAFEGVIPEDNYGAGAVIVWDGGVYENLRHDKKGHEVPMDEAIEQGHIVIRLHGRKLRGSFALQRTGMVRGKSNWILIKMRDEFASEDYEPIDASGESILSGRTVEQVAKDAAEDERAVPKWRAA